MRVLTPLTRVVFCLCATVVFAQAPKLADIQQQARSGHYEQAWQALQQLPPTPESLRAGVTISAQAGRLDRALSSYERLVTLIGRPDPAALVRLARAELERDRHDKDPLARAESCRALLRAGEPSCAAELERIATDASIPPRVRLSAAAATAERNTGGFTLLAQVARSLDGPSQMAITQEAADWPAAVAVPLLTRVLANPLPQIQALAAARLGDFDAPGVREALKAVAARQDFSPARSTARFSLARLGDREQLQAVSEHLSALEGDALYRGGCALAAAGDPRGLPALEQGMNTVEDPLLRLEAAAALARWSTEKARPVIEEALNKGTASERAHALLIVRRLGWSPSNDMWKLLKDPDAVVRARAAGICMGAVSRTTQATDAGEINRIE